MSDYKIDLKVDVINENCPKPLIETRKALKKIETGQVVEVIGRHAASRKEIPMAVEKMKHEVLNIADDDEGNWHIVIKKK